MRYGSGALLFALLPAAVLAADLSTSQRLELLERRVGRITNLTLELDQVRSENRELRGQIENLGYEIEQLKRKQRDLYLDIDQRLSAGQGAGAIAGSGAAVQQPAAGSGGAPVEAPATTQRRAPAAASSADRAQIETEYQSAYALLNPRNKQYAEAAKAFAAFLDRYPNDELSPNAQYWLGEAYYVTQKNADALQAFEAVVNNFPASTKVPDALFKIGKLREAGGKRRAARASYEKLVAEYPNSAAAGLARDRLDKIGN